VFALVAFVVRIASKIHLPYAGSAASFTDLWWDDLLITLSMMFVIGFCVLAIPCTSWLGNSIEGSG
jgi:hypothetical protein